MKSVSNFTKIWPIYIFVLESTNRVEIFIPDLFMPGSVNKNVNKKGHFVVPKTRNVQVKIVNKFVIYFSVDTSLISVMRYLLRDLYR